MACSHKDRLKDLGLPLPFVIGDPDDREEVAVAPASTQEVAALLAWASEHRIPVVPQGGRTGLSGGARPHPDGFVLLTDKLNRIVEIDVAGRIAIAEAGVTLEALTSAAAEHGLVVGVDLAARGSCTIGGMISTNAGGSEAFRHGTMRHRVLGLEAVLPDGRVYRDMKRVLKANEGLDLKHLFIGAEGTLGVVTRVALALVPRREPAVTVLAGFESASDAVRLFRTLQMRFGADLLLAEAMWRDYVALVAHAHGRERLAAMPGAEVFVIFQIADRAPDAVLQVLEEAALDGRLIDAVLAKNEAEVREMVLLREDSMAVDRELPDGRWFDISVPLEHLDMWTRTIRDRVSAIDPELMIFQFGHLGDGNLHITVTSGRPVGELKGEIARAVSQGLSELGGSFSAEHGIGDEKLAELAAFGDPVRIAAMRAVKAALDPYGIMNPGKLYPSGC